jgi:hypothetical protein
LRRGAAVRFDRRTSTAGDGLMPDLSGLPALNAAIGLVALFFLLSTAISAINEGIANLLGWRAKTLEDAIRNMLGDPKVKQGAKDLLRGGWRRIGRIRTAPETQPTRPLTDDVFDHWRIRALVRDPDSKLRRRSRPSYLPPRAFSLALSEVLAKRPNVDPNDAPSQTPWADKDDEILAQIRTTELPNPQLSALVNKAAVNAHETLEGFRVRVEGAFDDSMERASGWYKRKIQTMLLVLSAAVVIGLNVDTVRVAGALWREEPLRTAVAARAGELDGTPQEVANSFDDVSALDLPIGWGDFGWGDLPGALPGWLITIAALNLGAPFWFDVLSRLGRMRGAGVPERPRTLSDTAGTVDNDREARAQAAVARSEAAERLAATAPPASGNGAEPGETAPAPAT